ncbi:hypothetical protein Tco_1296931 [Tanacetum coccineum]
MAPNTKSVVVLVNNGTGGSGDDPIIDDNVRQMLRELVDVRFNIIHDSIDALTRMMTSNGVMRERNTKINAGNEQQLPYTRLAKLKFPKFSCDDVKGWVFRCEQFFILDQVPKAEKCSSQVYALDVLANSDTEEECLGEENLEDSRELPQISLNDEW